MVALYLALARKYPRKWSIRGEGALCGWFGVNQLDGGVSVDDGHRVVTAGSSRSGSSRTQLRADQSSPGAWDEDLGRWGNAEWELPGQGESGSGCGEWYPESVCTEQGHVEMASRVCGKRSCPDCWGSWAKGAAVRGTQRIQGFRYTQPNDYNRQVGYGVVSPPEGTIRNEREYWNGRKKAAEIAKEKGFRGFMIVPHPYRVTESGKQRYRAEDPEYGIWVWLRNDVEDMGRYIYWSPHYHIAGMTSANMEPGDEEGWTYNFNDSADPFDGVHDTDSHEELYGRIRYLLSHSGYPSGSTKLVVTWYGSLANSVFVEDATEQYQHQKPSDGVMSTLKREIEKVAGPTEDDDNDGDNASVDDNGACPRDDCEGRLIDVFDVSAYLRQADPPPDVRDRMITARDWRLGRVMLPAGLKRPQSEEEAREAFEALLENS